MEYWRRGRKRGFWVSNTALLCCASISILSLCALITIACSSSSICLDNRSPIRDSYSQGAAEGRRRASEEEEEVGGPGSYPPRCTGKCGVCKPCSPVHVPVPPGTPVIAEYYPEAWRCKCGTKLFMP